MPTQEWVVVGGGDQGGILVREGQALNSPASAERLQTGAVLLEEEVVGERLHFRLLTGKGPESGWVSLKLKDKVLVESRRESDSAPAAPTNEPPMLQEALGKPRAYLAAQRKGQPSSEYKGDPRAAAFAKECEKHIEELVPLGDPVPASSLVCLGELQFRAGTPLEAAAAFQQAVLAAGNRESDAESLRLAHIGTAAAAQSSEDLCLSGGPSGKEGAAAMTAAQALHRRSFSSLADANVSVNEPRDLRPSGTARAAIVLLHGWGGTGLDLRRAGEKLRTALGEPCRLVLPKGFYDAPVGSSWRDDRSDRCDPFRWDSVLRALAQVDTILCTLEADGIPSDKIILGGFSQGSFFAVLVALTRTPRVGGVLMLGGTVGGRVSAFLRTMVGPDGSPTARELPAFIGHGKEDKKVPLAMGMMAVEELKAIGLKNPEFKAYPGVGHEIPEQMLLDMGASARRWLKFDA